MRTGFHSAPRTIHGVSGARCERARARRAMSRANATPIFAVNGATLCADTSGVLWQHIMSSPDIARVKAMMMVCKSWRRHVLENYQRPLTVYRSIERPLPKFLRVHTLIMKSPSFAHPSPTVFGEAIGKLPALQHVDVSSCAYTSQALNHLVHHLGAKLLTFKHENSHDQFPTLDSFRAISRAPSLKELSFSFGTCGCNTNWRNNGVDAPPLPTDALFVLNGHSALETLTLDFRGRHCFKVPPRLPNLKTLSIKTSEYSGFIWPQNMWQGLSFRGLSASNSDKHEPMPKLERVFIDDHVSNPRSGLAACFITGWVSGFHPDQKVSITVTHAGSSSDIDNALLPWTCDNSVAREFGDVPLRSDYVGPLTNYLVF